MAIMIYDAASFERDATAGEKRVFEVLQDGLSDEVLVWFETHYYTNQRDHHPDFVVFSDDFGILLLEVKDWAIDNLIEVDQKRIEFADSSGHGVKTHPLVQVRRHGIGLVKKLTEKPELKIPNGNYQGKLHFPWATGVVLTNIARKELDIACWEEFFPRQLTITQDELAKFGGAFENQSLHKRLKDCFGYARQFDALKQIQKDQIFHVLGRPEVKDTLRRQQPPGMMNLNSVDHNDRRVAQIGDSSTSSKSETTAVQIEVLAKEFNHLSDMVKRIVVANESGAKVVYGAVGSGKTTLIVARARYLAITKPKSQILVLGSSPPLCVKLFRQLRAHSNVFVSPIENWLKANFGDSCKLMFDNNSDSTRDLIPKSRFDSVLIDQGQDMAHVWFVPVWLSLKNKAGELLIAIDGDQFPYRLGETFSWEQVGFRPKISKLTRNFLNSREIFGLAMALYKRRLPIHRYKDPRTKRCEHQKLNQFDRC